MASAPIRVELVPHSVAWADQARGEADALRDLLGPLCQAMRHVGSTSVPGIIGKPVIDLLVELKAPAMLDEAIGLLAGRGYINWGEYGVPGRRYASLDDPATGRRIVQLHCFEAGHPSAEAMLAFSAYLRAHPETACAYERLKQRCCRLHPDNSTDYARAKDAWIRSLEPTVVAWWRAGGAALDPDDKPATSCAPPDRR